MESAVARKLTQSITITGCPSYKFIHVSLTSQDSAFDQRFALVLPRFMRPVANIHGVTRRNAVAELFSLAESHG